MQYKRLTSDELTHFWAEAIAAQSEPIDIDLTPYRFANVSALVGMCALIDYCINHLSKRCRLIFPKMDSSGSIEFFRFIKNRGLEDLWVPERAQGKIEFYLRDETFLYDPRSYERKLPEEAFKRYTRLHRIWGTPEDRSTTLTGIVKDLEERLPPDHIRMPLFGDKEFEEVFLAELSENVAVHSETKGYFLARSISKQDLSDPDLVHYMLPHCSQEVKDNCITEGFFEIVIADCGRGIPTTLKSAYQLLRKVLYKHLQDDIERDTTDIDIIQFALDEFGSRFLSSENGFENLVERHSLNKIFQYTRKYGGSLRLLTDTYCLDFDTCKPIKRGKFGIGFVGQLVPGNWLHKGLNVRIILPHKTSGIQSYPKSRKLGWPQTFPEDRKVPVFFFVSSEISKNVTFGELRSKSSKLTRWALEKKPDKLVLDFSGTSTWDPLLFVTFLAHLDNLISNIDCWGLNVPQIHIELLKQRLVAQDVPVLPTMSRLLAFPCLEYETLKPYLISYDILPISDALSILLIPDQVDRDSTFGPEYSLSELVAHIKDITKITIDENDLDNILSRHPHLFEHGRLSGTWKARIDLAIMQSSANHLMVTNFRNLLNETGAIYPQHSQESTTNYIYQLPTTGLQVKEYIWTYRLLQRGHHTEEMSRRLKELLDSYFIEQHNDISLLDDIGAILCVTAPSRILAEALAKLLPNRPPVLDLGTINELDPDEVLRSFEQMDKRGCLIVTDVLNTLTQVTKLIIAAEKANGRVLAVAAIIRFTNQMETTWSPKVVKENFKKQPADNHTEPSPSKGYYAVCSLVDYPRPKPLEQTDIEMMNPESLQLNWIEPYSLRPFPIESLVKPYFAWEKEERDRHFPRRISLLDRKRCILYGHFKDRNHHNRILIHMERALQDIEIANYICDDILDFIKGTTPAVIIIPLHSNIRYLIPFLKSRLRGSEIEIPFICTIAVDLKGRGPFYLLPDEAQRIIKSVQKKNIMFLDDGILTGRTFETFLRALRNFTVKTNVRLENILAYAIINRTGRAASTKWRTVSQVFEKATFGFREFIRFECPVFSRDDCPLCKDKERLEEYTKKKTSTRGTVLKWLLDELKDLNPIVLGTHDYRLATASLLRFSEQDKQATDYEDTFLDIDSKHEANQVNHYRNKAKTSSVANVRLVTREGFLWWFWERNYRGASPTLLLEAFNEWLDDSCILDGTQEEYILTEVLLWALDNLGSLRTRSAWTGSAHFMEPIPDTFLGLCSRLLRLGGNGVPRILEKAGNRLSKTNDDLSNKTLFDLLSLCLEEMEKASSGEVVSSIFIGLCLIALNTNNGGLAQQLDDKFADKISQLGASQSKWHGYFRNLHYFLGLETSENEFIYSLRRLCQERYRPRHSTFFHDNSLTYFKEKKPSERFGYLQDSLPLLNKALDDVFSLDKKTDIRLAKDIRIISDFSDNVCEMLRNNLVGRHRHKLFSCLQQISYRLREDYRIGERLDYYNPSILRVLNTLKEDEEKTGEIAAKIGRVNIEVLGEGLLAIFGERSLLKDTIRNHTWDVLKNHGNPESVIKLKVFGTENIITVVIFNNFIEAKEALALVKKGHSMYVEKKLWEKYNGKIEDPSETDGASFKSKITLHFERSLRTF